MKERESGKERERGEKDRGIQIFRRILKFHAYTLTLPFFTSNTKDINLELVYMLV